MYRTYVRSTKRDKSGKRIRKETRLYCKDFDVGLCLFKFKNRLLPFYEGTQNLTGARINYVPLKRSEKLYIRNPVVEFPDFSKPFNITTNTFGYAIGAILSQDELGTDLSHTHCVYCRVENFKLFYLSKKNLARIYAVNHF